MMPALNTVHRSSHPAYSTRLLVVVLWAAAGIPASMNAQPKHTIAYSGFAPRNTDIFIADADGRNSKPFLANSAQDFNPSFSRDGNWIVFTSDRNGSADIYRAHPDGTGLEQLTDDPSFDDQAALSPDGRTVAFISSRSGHAELWTLDLPAKKLHNITNHAAGHFRPAWSPDGEWIAISSDRDSPNPRRPDGFELIQQTEIYILHPDGSGLRRLTHTNSYAGSPGWSPDGKRIVFYKASFEDVIRISDPRHLRATTQIAVVDVASGQEKELTQGKGEKWSPEWIANGRIGYFSGGPEGGAEFITNDAESRNGSAGARGEFNSRIGLPTGAR
jgi:TolB protein